MSHDTYTIKPLPPFRHLVIDALELASRKHCIHGLIEVDVTKPRRRLREIRQETGVSLSFTGFIIYCCARAVDQNKLVHACRDWRNRLVLFDEVDISVPAEGLAVGPLPQAIIRAANRKSVKDIHQITDGAPAARFIQQFKGLVESGSGLFEE